MIDWGLNFGIVELPLFAAQIPGAPFETVVVYFDDQGWIVAYLPKDRPAAAVWKHKRRDDSANQNYDPSEVLERNLLVLAISEVLKANDVDAEEVSHSDVGYYDWQNPSCDAFVLFSGASDGGESDRISFVIPRTIASIQSSAAVAMTEQTEQGGSDIATLAIDGETVVSTSNEKPLDSSGFTLKRDAEETSLHRMTVRISGSNAATGVTMLVYDKP